ncbi:MAG: 8-oxo-dGTP diphosphatase [Ignavibacteriales bacterium]|jgi:8-oxo-dGTP diphosphatase|nr:8-oxo-dGTP diphosphatase [Ignavibacteriales bacterium]MBK7267572.1 8-oxo-dGTP diphosphatase [Ignavibacteriales bacterium]
MKLATLCYVRDAKNLTTLMLHRVKKENDMHEGKWNGLGGKFEDGETPEECVIREVLEESGLSITNPKLQGFITFPAFDQFEDWYVFVFTADEFTGELIDSPEGNLEWIKNDNLMDLKLWEGDKIFMGWFDSGKVFSAKFEYDKGEFVSHDVIFY